MIKPKTEKKCAKCGEPFKPFKTTDKYCSPKCYYESKPNQEKKVVRFSKINKVSDSRKKLNAEYERLKKIFFADPENKYCKIKGTNCTIIATHPEHTKGRIGNNLIDVSTWLPACSNCNLELETNTELSQKFQLSRFHSGKKIIK